MSWKKILLIAAVAGAFTFASAPKSEAGVRVGIGIGVGFPVGYYGCAYPYPAYYPYGYPYYGYYRAGFYRGPVVYRRPVVIRRGHRFVRAR